MSPGSHSIVVVNFVAIHEMKCPSYPFDKDRKVLRRRSISQDNLEPEEDL